MKLQSIVVAILLGITILFGGLNSLVPVQANPMDSLSIQIAQSPSPVTYMTPKNSDEIMVQITEGEFKYYGLLKRTMDNKFIGSDGQVRVIYDRETGRVVVINEVTGDEYYNYLFSEVDEGYL
ncbi:MAG: hypothetical protein AAFO04_07865 [Cyanobacteria bacterium J06592_8]